MLGMVPSYGDTEVNEAHRESQVLAKNPTNSGADAGV